MNAIMGRTGLILFLFACPVLANWAAAGVPISLGCDYNNDTYCDTADYVQWRNGGPLHNEGVSFGQVLEDDYRYWRENYGLRSTAAGATESVPEPSGFLIGLTACCGYVIAFWRRR